MVAPSQTLDRGLAVLEELAEAPRPLLLDELAIRMGLHRSIVYRLVRTLEDRHLVERDPAGRYGPGVRLAVLARSVRTSLRLAAAPMLAELAETLGMTAFLVVRDGDEAVTIESVEPRGLDATVSYRPGSRHAVDRGAPGLALLAGGPFTPGERPEVTLARTVGWTMTASEVLPGIGSIAAPIGTAGALAVVYLAARSVAISDLGGTVHRAANTVSARLG